MDVGIAAAEAISDLLIELKERATAASDTGLDSASRNSLNDDFGQLRDQITSIVSTAEFNGINLVDGSDNVNAVTNDTGTSNISISGANLSLGSSVITVTSSASISTTTGASTQVSAIETSIDNLNNILSRFGAGSTRLEVQQEFTTSLSDAIEVGIGNLVDADLAQESANLQALQVRQQLGLQALSIANQAPATVLGLF